MDPVEINAGSWYLRALRADERVDDRPALRAAGLAPEDYVEIRQGQWSTDSAYSWAVCVPETGEMIAEVELRPLAGTLADVGPARLSGWALTGRDDALAAAISAVRRFAESGLGLTVDGEWPL